MFGSGGSSAQPALKISNEVFQELFSPTQPWPFNRFKLPVFYTNSYQQDYAIPGLTKLAWLEHGFGVDINNSAIPKPICGIECVRDQEQTYAQGPNVALASRLPNSQLYYGTWGAPNVGGGSLGNNPQPGQAIINPLGQPSQPANPILQIQDANGNLLVLTTYGTTGSTAPSAAVNAAAGTTVTDGAAVWTVVDPNGQGIRIGPLPGQTSTVWQVNLIGQLKPPVFTNLNQTISPIPDDLTHMFTNGFLAFCWRYHPEQKIAARFDKEYAIWQKSIATARQSQNREKEEFGFVPSQGIMSGGSIVDPGPAWPFAGWGGMS